MNPKAKKSGIQHEHLGIKVTHCDISASAAINYEIDDVRYRTGETLIHRVGADMEIIGSCVYPDERAGAEYAIHVSTTLGREPQFQATLEDFRALDSDGIPKTRKRGDRYIAIYEPPFSIGFLDKTRGENRWTGACWVNNDVMSFMIQIASLGAQLYVALHEVKRDRRRSIRGITLQTNDPSLE